MSRFISRATLYAAFFTLAVLPSAAQDARQPGSNPRLTHDQVRRATRDIEDRSDDFKKSLRRALNSSVLDGSNREDDLNRQAKRLESAMDRVKKGAEQRRSFQDIRRDVDRAMDAGRDINVTMRRRRFNSEAERDWERLRAGLNFLGGLFGISKLS